MTTPDGGDQLRAPACAPADTPSVTLCPQCGRLCPAGERRCRRCLSDLSGVPTLAASDAAERIATERAAGARDARARRRRRSLAAVAALAAIAVLGWWMTRDTTPAPLIASSDRGEPAMAGATWSRAHGGAAATRASTARLPASANATWRYTSEAPVLGFSADRERVYVARADGLLVALDANTGEARWQLTVPGQLDEPPAIAGDRLYIGQRDGRVLAIEGATGRVAWSRMPANAFFLRSAPLIRAGLAWAVSEHSLVLYDAESGEVLRETRHDEAANPVGAVAVGEHVTFSTGRDARVLSRVNGAHTFSYPLEDIEFLLADGSIAIALGGARLLALREDARPHWWERFRRQWSIVSFVGVGPMVPPPPREWISPAPATALAPALGDGRVFVADGSGAISAYALETGALTWERADAGARGAPVLTPDGLVIPVADALLVLDPATGDERARVALAETPHALIVTEGATYITVGRGAQATAVIAIRD